MKPLHEQTIHQPKMVRLIRLMSLLHRGPASIEGVARECGVNQRTAYRYLTMLQEAGLEINLPDAGKWHKYFSFKVGACPICGK
jgi:predicted DNA-binding transcriptional regulator YafY